MSRRQNELVSKFKIVAGYKISIRGQVMEYMYIPTGIRREFVRIGVDFNQRGTLLGLLEEDQWSFILVDRLFLVSPTEKESH